MTVVAIDGPAGAGKSTVARLVANRLGFRYVDTGAIYRALALEALKREADLGDGPALAQIAIELEISADGSEVSVDGKRVTDQIRSEEVSAAVSRVAAHAEVRAALIELQRSAAAGSSCVMEGRDIGTAVFPDAEVKVYLTADAATRAVRRWEQMGSPASPSVDEVEGSIKERDRIDSQRATSPLVRPDDAHVIDTSGRPVDEVVAAIVSLAGGARGSEE